MDYSLDRGELGQPGIGSYYPNHSRDTSGSTPHLLILCGLLLGFSDSA